MDLENIEEALNKYIRPQTFPVAVKMVSSEEEVPEKARKPKDDLGVRMPVCQVISLARRYGWLMAMDKEDMLCPLGALTLGLVPAKEKFLDGSFNVPFWVKDQESRAKIAKELPTLEEGKYSHIVVAPLHRTDFDPQVIIVYGNPAQISRLIQASVYATDEPVDSSSSGGFACGSEITEPILTDKCNFIVVGGGDRAIAQTQDDEISFAAPMSKLSGLIEGLEKTHEAGMRYPTTPFLTYEGQFPPSFEKLMNYLKEEEAE